MRPISMTLMNRATTYLPQTIMDFQNLANGNEIHSHALKTQKPLLPKNRRGSSNSNTGKKKYKQERNSDACSKTRMLVFHQGRRTVEGMREQSPKWKEMRCEE